MYGWYANDIWKVTRNLSLNLGVRYEYLTTPVGWAQQSLNAIANDPNVIPGVCCTFSAPTTPSKDFMPRIGFAYSPGTSGNTSIRGGYSMGYDVLYDNIGTLSVRRRSVPPRTVRVLSARRRFWPTRAFHRRTRAALPL